MNEQANVTDAMTDITDAGWEIFCDASYFDLWCLRRPNDKRWGSGVHFVSKDGAEQARDFIEASTAALQAENEKLRRLFNIACDDLEGVGEDDLAASYRDALSNGEG